MRIGIFLAVTLVVLGTGAAAQTPLPEGPGKTVVEHECARCHGLSEIVKAHRSKERWATIVDEMISRGAQLSDVEIDQVVAYLAKNFGKESSSTDSKN